MISSCVSKLKYQCVLYAALVIIPAMSCETRDGRASLPQKDAITVAVTDSGLGGLSIMAEAAARLKELRLYRVVNLVFANSLFSNESGYNKCLRNGNPAELIRCRRRPWKLRRNSHSIRWVGRCMAT